LALGLETAELDATSQNTRQVGRIRRRFEDCDSGAPRRARRQRFLAAATQVRSADPGDPGLQKSAAIHAGPPANAPFTAIISRALIMVSLGSSELSPGGSNAIEWLRSATLSQALANGDRVFRKNRWATARGAARFKPGFPASPSSASAV